MTPTDLQSTIARAQEQKKLEPDFKKLMWSGVRTLQRRRKKKDRRSAFWGEVSDFFGCGSTTAYKACRALGIDPDTGEETADAR